MLFDETLISWGQYKNTHTQNLVMLHEINYLKFMEKDVIIMEN